VLIAEESQAVLDQLSEFFRNLDFEVKTCVTGYQANKLVRISGYPGKKRFDLVILGLEMPQSDGY